MYKGMLAIALTGFAMVNGSAASHDVNAIECAACVEDAQFLAQAVELATQTVKGGSFHVYNLGANRVQTWWIPPRSEHGNGVAGALEWPAARKVESRIAVAELDRAQKFYRAANNSLRPMYTVPVSALHLPVATDRTADDVVHDYNLNAQIGSRLADESIINRVVDPLITRALVDLTDVRSNVLGLQDHARLVFRLVMDDGSSIDYELDARHTVATALLHTVRTAAGTQISASSPSRE